MLFLLNYFVGGFRLGTVSQHIEILVGLFEVHLFVVFVV